MYSDDHWTLASAVISHPRLPPLFPPDYLPHTSAFSLLINLTDNDIPRTALQHPGLHHPALQHPGRTLDDILYVQRQQSLYNKHHTSVTCAFDVSLPWNMKLPVQMQLHLAPPGV